MGYLDNTGLAHLWGKIKDSKADKPTITEAMLWASGWTGTASPYAQEVMVGGGTATSQVDIQADAVAIQQMLDDGTSAIYIANGSGTFTAYAVGEKPSADLIVRLTVYDVKGV